MGINTFHIPLELFHDSNSHKFSIKSETKFGETKELHYMINGRFDHNFYQNQINCKILTEEFEAVEIFFDHS